MPEQKVTVYRHGKPMEVNKESWESSCAKYDKDGYSFNPPKVESEPAKPTKVKVQTEPATAPGK